MRDSRRMGIEIVNIWMLLVDSPAVRRSLPNAKPRRRLWTVQLQKRCADPATSESTHLALLTLRTKHSGQTKSTRQTVFRSSPLTGEEDPDDWVYCVRRRSRAAFIASVACRVVASEGARGGMSSLAADIQEARARHLSVSEEALTVDLVDGRTIIVPLVWYPRLWHGTAEERSHFEIFGDGAYIHWPDLDEDLTVAGLLAGRRSGESPQSLKRWLEVRKGSGN